MHFPRRHAVGQFGPPGDPSKRLSRHFWTNLRITADGDGRYTARAYAVTAVTMVGTPPAPAAGATVAIGVSTDGVVVEDGQARFASRALDISFQGRLEARAGGGEPLDPSRLRAPIRRPGKFMGIGFNYSSHVEEVRRKGHPVLDLSNQVWFNKQTSCIVGPYDAIHLPAISDQLDYECELAVVIGRRCRHVSRGDAFRVIAGYTVTKDVSVRDWQLKAPTATLGRSFDTDGPTGPWITTADAVPDPETLGIRTLVDGVVKQDGNTGEMVNGIAAQIACLS